MAGVGEALEQMNYTAAFGPEPFPWEQFIIFVVVFGLLPAGLFMWFSWRLFRHDKGEAPHASTR